MTACRMMGYERNYDWFGIIVDGTHGPEITSQLEAMKRFVLYNFTCEYNWLQYKIKFCTWDKKVSGYCPADDGINWQLLALVCKEKPGR